MILILQIHIFNIPPQNTLVDLCSCQILIQNTIVGLFFNGCIHWLARRPDLFMDVIIAFDLMERKLFNMPFPDCFNHEPRDWGLWVFGESLSLFAKDYVRRRVEIWVMKEYNVHSYWTLHPVLPIDDISTIFFSPICSTKSGDIVSTDGRTGLLKYNDKKQLIEHYYYCDGRLPIRSKVTVYTESLLSVPGDNVQV